MSTATVGTLLLLGVNVLGLVLALIGESMVTNSCLNSKFRLYVSGPSNGDQVMACGTILAFSWWTLALQGFTITIMTLACLVPTLTRQKHILSFFVAVSTVLLCLYAQTATTEAYMYQADYSKVSLVPHAWRLMSAGCIIMLVANFAAYILFGWEPQEQPTQWAQAQHSQERVPDQAVKQAQAQEQPSTAVALSTAV